MERFGLSRLDLMLMSWGEVGLMFDATYDEPDEEQKQDVREATPEEYGSWI